MRFQLPDLSPKTLVAYLMKVPRPTFVDVLHYAVALAAAVAFALGYGLTYGVSNQTAYMLGALKMLDPTVLADDWYASHTANYHPAFTYVGWFLLLFSRKGFAVALGQTAAIAWGAMGVHRLCRTLWAPWARALGQAKWGQTLALATFLAMTAVMTLTLTASVGVSYIFDAILQPSTLGGLFFTLSMAPFVEGRWLKSGIYLALSGLFHANYLLLGMAAYGIAHLVLGSKGLVRRGLAQLGPSLVPLLILAPMILASAKSPDAARAQEILFFIRSPHHYNPRSFERAFYPFAGWQLLGVGIGGFLLQRAGHWGRRFGALLFALALVVWVGIGLTTIVYIPKVAQLFVFRLAPFIELMAQLLIVAAVVHLLARPTLAKQVSFAGWTTALIGALILGLTKLKRDSPLPTSTTVTVVLILAVLVWLGARAAISRIPNLARFETRARQVSVGVISLLALVVTAEVTLPRAISYRKRSNVFAVPTGAENDLYTWIRGNTPKSAIFLSPPQMERFRLDSERGIVVDWKGSTYLPSELVAWYQRLEDVSGRKGFKRERDLIAGYGALDDARLEALKQRYGFSYVVVGRGQATRLKNAKVVYENSRYAVLSLQ